MVTTMRTVLKVWPRDIILTTCILYNDNDVTMLQMTVYLINGVFYIKDLKGKEPLHKRSMSVPDIKHLMPNQLQGDFDLNQPG